MIDCEAERFVRSIVFRFPAKHPFEEIVDFMIIEESRGPARLKLICATGHHAGQTELIFPEESMHSEGGICVNWLKTNWEKWVYQECKLEDVKYISEYPSNHGNKNPS